MIASLALAALLATAGGAGTDPIVVSPAEVVIDGLYPGTTGYGQVALTYTRAGTASMSVTGHLTSAHDLSKDDALDVVVAACARPWGGIPTEPTSAPALTQCDSGEVTSSGGSLAALPLEEGQTVYLLISATLPAGAGNDAQGQQWTASFDVQTVAEDPAPAPALDLAVTGADARRLLAAAGAALVAGAALFLRSRRHQGTNR